LIRERDLLRRAQRGDRHALEALCREEWLAVYRIVAARTASRQEAEDLTQEVFARAIGRLSTYAPRGARSFRPYLIGVARNLLADRWRTHQRVGAQFALDPAQLAAADGDPEAEALAAADRAALVAALARLSALHQRVLRLRLLDGRSASEVGAILERSPDAVRQLQHRALEALRLELDRDQALGA
jgi:RNA polymerase sigma-70 factor, ECF subfamily